MAKSPKIEFSDSLLVRHGISAVLVSEDVGYQILDTGFQTDLRRRASPIQNPVSGIQHRLRMGSSFLRESTGQLLDSGRPRFAGSFLLILGSLRHRASSFFSCFQTRPLISLPRVESYSMHRVIFPPGKLLVRTRVADATERVPPPILVCSICVTVLMHLAMADHPILATEESALSGMKDSNLNEYKCLQPLPCPILFNRLSNRWGICPCGMQIVDSSAVANHRWWKRR